MTDIVCSAYIIVYVLQNTRSKKVKGLQLLLGIMLVARATSRQVRSTTITINIHTVNQLYSIYHVGNHSTEPCRRMQVIHEYKAVSQTVDRRSKVP